MGAMKMKLKHLVQDGMKKKIHYRMKFKTKSENQLLESEKKLKNLV